MPSEIPSQLSKEEVQKLLDGETLIFSTALESTEGHPVILELYMLPTSSPRKWVLVTAIANQIDIGYVDVEYIPRVNQGSIEGKHFRHSAVYFAPHSDIRTEFDTQEDGFYVIKSERNRKVGQALFDAARAILLGMGAYRLLVSHTSQEAESFYRRNGGQQFVNGFYFEYSLQSHDPDEIS